MTTAYKVSYPDAQAMVEQWASMTPELYNASPSQIAKTISHFTTEIQQDGSHTAFLDWANSLPKQPGATPQTAQNFQQAVAQYTQQNGRAPYTPATGAVQNQYPGTNTKTLGAEVGRALTSPVGQAIESVIAGALDVATAGAATPFTTAGEAAVQALGNGLQPGANFGTILKSGLTGAGEGALAGTGANLLNNVTGNALVSGAKSALPTASAVGTSADLSNLTPSQIAAIGDASGGAAADTSGVDLTAGMTPQQLADAGNATNGTPGTNAPLPSVQNVVKSAANFTGGPSSPGGGVPSLLNDVGTDIPFLLGAANAANLQAQAQQYAQDAVNTETGQYATQAPLRAAGMAGLLNPSTPAPGLPAIQALNTAAAKGNPFATAVPLPSTPAGPSVSASQGLPTGLPTASPVSTAPTTPVNRPAISATPTLPTAQPVAGGGSPSPLIRAM